MVDTIKFSEFSAGGDLENDNITVGIKDGTNTQFNNPWTFLPEGTTDQRPDPSAEMYYRLRFNTTDTLYEYYNADTSSWVQLDDEDTILALLASHTAGEGASLVGLQNQSTVVDKTVQDLANAAIIAQTNNGTLVNGVYLNLLSTGYLSVTTSTGALTSRLFVGTTDQIDIANDDSSANPVFSLSSTLVLPGTLTLGGDVDVMSFDFTNSVTNGGFSFITNGSGLWTLNATQGINGISNDPTLAADSAELVPTQAAVKAYVATISSGFTPVAGGPCVAATTEDFASAYDNGAAGVGATLTQDVAAVVVIDGVTINLNDRVLFQDQTDQTENGIYYMSTVGTDMVQAVFTRSTDYDTTSEIIPGSFVAVKPGGTQWGGSIWVETQTVAAIGTDPIDFQLLAQPSNTFVTLATNQAISGIKTFASGSLLLAGSSSGTTGLQASPAAGTTVATLPPTTDTLVANDYAATLTNKTISGNSNTLSDISWLSIAANTPGAIAIWDASGNPTVLAPGTSGYVVTSQGPGSPPIYASSTSGSGQAPTQQKFTSGSGTYTTPTSPAPIYIKIQMVGGGGGGAGGGVSTAGNGSGGGTTTFGTSLLTCSGGSGGSFGAYGGTYGSASISSPAYGFGLSGSYGDPGTFINTNTNAASWTASGGNGGASYFGGQGGGGPNGFAGQAGAAFTGAGGGGGGRAGTTLAASSGGGGGSGGYIEAYIDSPSATYSYNVGTGGAGGSPTSYGGAGGAGASGIIIVTEYYS